MRQSAGSTEESLDYVIGVNRNPFKSIWDKFMREAIDAEEVCKRIREWRLRRLKRYKYQSKPLPPDSDDARSIENWRKACRKTWLENRTNKETLRILLTDLEEGKLKGEQGIVEIIKGMTEEF